MSDARPLGSVHVPDDPEGPFIGIGLPPDLVAELAGLRAHHSLVPEDIAGAALHRLDTAEAGCLLMGGTLDALDIIAALLAAGFRGSVTVVAPLMPNPSMVEQELQSAASPLSIRLLMR